MSTQPIEAEEPVYLVDTPTRWSAEIGELVKALAAAQLEFTEIIKKTSNPFYKSKYADLSAVIAATQPGLAKHGIVVMQFPIVTGDYAGVDCILAHSSGQWLAKQFLLPMSKIDAQGAGSAVTYARRYGYQAIVGVAADEDDDANAATGAAKPPIKLPARASASTTATTPEPYNEPEPMPPGFWGEGHPPDTPHAAPQGVPPAAKQSTTVKTISRKQMGLLWATARERYKGEEDEEKNARALVEAMLRLHHWKSTTDIPAAEFDAVLADLRPSTTKQA